MQPVEDQQSRLRVQLLARAANIANHIVLFEQQLPVQAEG